MLTPSPKMSPSLTMTSPTLMPMRKRMLATLVERSIGNGKIALDLDGALHRGEDAGEFGEDAVAGGTADPAAMLRDERIDDDPVGRERRQRRFLVGAHQPAVAFDVGGEDGDELSLQRRRFHGQTRSFIRRPRPTNRAPDTAGVAGRSGYSTPRRRITAPITAPITAATP